SWPTGNAGKHQNTAANLFLGGLPSPEGQAITQSHPFGVRLSSAICQKPCTETLPVTVWFRTGNGTGHRVPPGLGVRGLSPGPALSVAAEPQAQPPGTGPVGDGE